MKNLKSNFASLAFTAFTLVFLFAVQSSFAQEQPTTEQKQKRAEQKTMDAKEPTTEQMQQRSEQNATDAKEPTAEQKQKRAEAQSGSPTKMSDEDMKKGYDDRMKRYHENYDKLSKRAASTNNPEMKKDIEALQAQMNEAKTSMDNFMTNKDSMTPEQKERAHNSLREQEERLKKNYEEMKSKYASSEKSGDTPKRKSADDVPKQ